MSHDFTTNYSSEPRKNPALPAFYSPYIRLYTWVIILHEYMRMYPGYIGAIHIYIYTPVNPYIVGV